MLIQWRSKFEVGVAEIDDEHRHLAHLVNSFYDQYRAGAARNKVHTVLNLLVQYVETHFQHEEALMEAGEYPGLASHRDLHDALARRIFQLNEQYVAGTEEISDATMEFLKAWLLDHILEEDKKLQVHFQGRSMPEGFHRSTV